MTLYESDNKVIDFDNYESFITKDKRRTDLRLSEEDIFNSLKLPIVEQYVAQDNDMSKYHFTIKLEDNLIKDFYSNGFFSIGVGHDGVKIYSVITFDHLI